MDEPLQDVEELLPVATVPDFPEAEVYADALTAAGVPGSVGEPESGVGFHVLVGAAAAARAQELLGQIRAGGHAQSPTVKTRLEAVATYRLAGRRFVAGEAEAALELWKQATAAWPEFQDALTSMGYAYRSLGRYQEALGAFRRAAEAGGDDPNLWIGLGKVHGDLFQYDDARRAFAHALDLDPEEARAWRGIGHTRLLEFEYPQALEAFAKALELEPGDRRTLYCVATIEYHRGQYRSALAVLEGAMRGGTEAVDIPLLAALARSRLGEFAEAMRLVDQAKLLAPESPDAYLTLALVQAAQKQWENAAAAFALAVKYGPRSLNVLAWQAWFQSIAEDPKYRNAPQALEDAQRAVALEPRNPELLAILAQAQFANGRREAAQATIAQALAIIPDALPYQELAARFARRGGGRGPGGDSGPQAALGGPGAAPAPPST
ncbi:MAG: tetratricopeptide repeat protein [Planctomycetes bacterium]|nr:tetratricopeptide repeat protein [Planctomycetota bacterium]